LNLFLSLSGGMEGLNNIVSFICNTCKILKIFHHRFAKQDILSFRYDDK
jgi:hypothetical protein